MAGCSRTWLNQMVNTDTSRGVQKYFGISRTVKYSCSAKHTTTKPTPWISVENGIRHDDLFISQEYMDQDSRRPSLADYLIHAIPREGTGTPRSTIWPALHLSPPIPCSHPACDAEAAAESISTESPLILRVDPNRHGDNLHDGPLVTDIVCPLILNLCFDVEYTLIARVIFIPPVDGGVGHYVTKTRLKGGTYLYNDLRHNGLLTELGPLHLLEDHDPATSFVVYLRQSRASTTSRMLAEIAAEYAKIPPPPPAVPIRITGESDDEIDRMLIDSITPPTKNTSIGPGLSPLPPSSDRFFTPEESPGLPDSDSTTTCPVRCDGCKEYLPEGDDDPLEVQCENCRFWSHIKCLTPGVNWNDLDQRFVCGRCQDDLDGKLFVPNQVVLLPHPNAEDWKAPDTIWYPARFIEHHKNRKAAFNEYELRWLKCNDGTVYYSTFSALPVLMVRTIYRSRKFLKEVQDVQLTEKQIGNIRLPFYMKPDDPNHKNPALTAIFDAALPAVAEILAKWENWHLVIKSFQSFFLKKRKHAQAREVGDWMLTLGLNPTPELEAVLSDPLMHLMGHDALLSITQQECGVWVMGVGSVLFQLAVQHELGEPLNLNGDLFEDLKDESLISCRPDGDAALNAMFTAIPSNSTKSGILAQQMLRFKRDHTIFDPELRPPLFRRDRPSHFSPTKSIPVAVQIKGA
ncbi:hypothetical protein B0H19DRAFT_1079425 [Mycena capillaripes]|nr:hypothetical protein B0H19DRAFT_1079425 [Mycena capillaripes]